MIDDLVALTGDVYKITPKIEVRNPTLREIHKYGEQQYFGLAQTICATPADRKVEIWDAMGVYWDTVDEYELFVSTFKAIQQRDTKILFGDLDIASFQPMISKNLNDLKLKKANDDKLAQEQYEAAKELGKKLETGKVEMSIKTGEGGKAFGSIASKEIAAEVKEQMGLDVDKKKIQLKEAIKTLGTHNVPIKLHPKVTVDLKVIVNEEA